MNFSRTTHSMHRQRGTAFIVMLVFLIMGITAYLVSSLNGGALQLKRDEVTAAALAQAKEALIGYAVSTKLSSTCVVTNCALPGELPCPDTSNSGTADASCGGSALGRLPWKTLGLPDLRDGSGERLWYAVSVNFKKFPHVSCDPVTNIGCLNSDTPGTVSVFASNGALLNDGGSTGVSATGAVAVIIAPGDVLKRQGNASPQDRSGPDNGAAKNTPNNYLDIATVGSITEDNASFTNGSSSIGFIQGRIKDSAGNLIVNDQLLVITQDNIMQLIQKRVATEVKLCLNDYASANSGRYPWAVPLNDLSYTDQSGLLFGRIPDVFTHTVIDGATYSMAGAWGVCNTHTSNTPGTWWLNWREMVFYGLADAYKPLSATLSCPTCLTVTPPSAMPNKQFVVIVAGKKLAGQPRGATDKSTLINYLELQNSSGTTTFTQNNVSASFNDTVVFQQ